MSRSDYGDYCERAALSLRPYCFGCRGRMINMNDIKRNIEGIDLRCENKGCNCAIQVKGSRVSLFSRDHVLRNGGKYHIMSKTSRKYRLRYIVLQYDSSSLDIVDAWESDTIRNRDIQPKDSEYCEIFTSWTNIL
jgi:hypothetical protein